MKLKFLSQNSIDLIIAIYQVDMSKPDEILEMIFKNIAKEFNRRLKKEVSEYSGPTCAARDDALDLALLYWLLGLRGVTWLYPRHIYSQVTKLLNGEAMLDPKFVKKAVSLGAIEINDTEVIMLIKD